jgi:hypothetical protein
LINNVSTTVLARLGKYRDQGADPKHVSIISDNFRLDARSDPATLDKITMDAVCGYYCEEVGASPMQMITSPNPDHKIFLLADREVLQNLDSGILKVVQAVPSGNDPECYFQWMRLWSKLLIEFWVHLEVSDYGLWDFIWEEQPGALYTG